MKTFQATYFWSVGSLVSDSNGMTVLLLLSSALQNLCGSRQGAWTSNSI